MVDRSKKVKSGPHVFRGRARRSEDDEGHEGAGEDDDHDRCVRDQHDGCALGDRRAMEDELRRRRHLERGDSASDVPATVTGHHTLNVYVYSPSGSTYQTFSVPFSAGSAAGAQVTGGTDRVRLPDWGLPAGQRHLHRQLRDDRVLEGRLVPRRRRSQEFRDLRAQVGEGQRYQRRK